MTIMFNRLKQIYATLGLPLTVALGALLVLILWFAFGGISEAFSSYSAQREINKLTQEADVMRVKVKQAETERDQAIGAASAYKAQADQVQNELTELFNARPELQKQVAIASQKVNQIRNSRPVPVTDDMRNRIDNLGANLDKLYPDPAR